MKRRRPTDRQLINMLERLDADVIDLLHNGTLFLEHSTVRESLAWHWQRERRAKGKYNPQEEEDDDE